MKSVFAALVIVSSSVCGMTGCANRAISASSSYFNALINPLDLKGNIVLERCEPNSNPLKCKSASFVCKKAGCERLQVVKHARRTGDRGQRNSALPGSN